MNPSTRHKVEPPLESEKEDFFNHISKEELKKPVIISVIQPYSNSFIHYKDYLPRALQNLFTTAYLEADFNLLTTLAESYMHYDITPAMVDHLHELTQDQAKPRNWFNYRAGRITASHFRQVLHTDPHQPSLSLLKSICYPEICKFSTQAATRGCEYERMLLKLTKLARYHPMKGSK